MIVLDTHIWVWWAAEDAGLRQEDRSNIQAIQQQGLGVSAFSVWEVAKLFEKKRLEFSMPLSDWVDQALALPFIKLIPISPAIIVDSVHLPGNFHKDPADQIIIATARVLDCPLLTYDQAIIDYPHVKKFARS